jgi:hypothetical protein
MGLAIRGAADSSIKMRHGNAEIAEKETGHRPWGDALRALR